LHQSNIATHNAPDLTYELSQTMTHKIPNNMSGAVVDSFEDVNGLHPKG
jgi:hypothetical protein